MTVALVSSVQWRIAWFFYIQRVFRFFFSFVFFFIFSFFLFLSFLKFIFIVDFRQRISSIHKQCCKIQISTNGYISFAYFSDDASTLQLGLDVDWPTQSDPAVIAPYLCKWVPLLSPQIGYHGFSSFFAKTSRVLLYPLRLRQRIQSGQGADSRVFYRVETRRGAVQSGEMEAYVTSSS